jgi:protein-S-isoprenylcysteine O-methyltransferase Ste14
VISLLGNSLLIAEGFTPGRVVVWSWVAFVLYWVWAARSQKRLQRREPVLARLLHVAYMAFGFALLYAPDPRFGPLNRRFLPEREWIDTLGAVLTVAGVAFAIWARHHIGRNWSGQVTIRQGHELIRTGPYAHIRHPIYTGILLALAGTAIELGVYRALLAFVVLFVGFTIKARREESFLSSEFGSAFEEHRRHTGFLLPR